MNTCLKWLIVTAIAAAAVPLDALAQMPDGSIVIPSDIGLHDIGWGQISNLPELQEFFLAVLETMAFVAAFAFHPRANALRQDGRGWMIQASMFFFGLIGMLVGFLVVHHGYLIGFVIFGIGGLFRFRMESSSLLDGALLILMTLMGLTVGLNLPVMALVATIAGWTILWFVTVRKTSALELKYKDDESLRRALTPVRTALENGGYRVVSVKKADFKPVVTIVLSHNESNLDGKIPAILDAMEKDGFGAKDWYVA